MIRLVVADDHLVVREGLVAILATDPSCEVVAEASTGREAIAAVLQHEPDVLLLDLQMPDIDGVATIRALRGSDCATRILVFTAYDDDDLIVDAVRAGVDGYLLKGTGRDELLGAIATVARGGKLLQAGVATKILARLGDPSSPVQLTPREQEVVELLAEGLSNKEVARVLGITERTAKFHVSSLLQKLDVENRTEAVTRALQLKLIEI